MNNSPDLRSDAEKLAAGYTKHICKNMIPRDCYYCPFCKRFNEQTSVENCVQCNRILDERKLFLKLKAKYEPVVVEPPLVEP